MKIGLTKLEGKRVGPIFLLGLMTLSVGVSVSLQAEEKKTYTHTADLRSGKEDALLDILRPISEEFESEYRALGTAYTTGEILFQQKRFDDAIRNFDTVSSKGKKYAFLAECA